MFALFRASSSKRRGARDAPSTVAVEREADRYVTDGINLYRVVDDLRGSSGHGVVGVEDCRSLDVILVRTDEFHALGLRPIRPAAAT